MPTYYSPKGNVEVWEERPEGYLTPEEWAEAHPAPEPPSPTLDEAKADAAQQIKDAGYAAEIKGITLQGMTIPTDRESQSMITGAVVGTLLDPTKTTRWQTATTQDGMPIFIDLPAEKLAAVGAFLPDDLSPLNEIISIDQ